MGLAVVANSALEPTRRHVDVREVVRELRHNHPRAGEERIAQLLVERIEEDRHLLRNAARVLVHQFMSVAEAREPQRRASSAPERARREAANRAEVKAAVAKVKAAVLDMVINGKALRFHSGAEVARLGAGFTKLAERVGPDAMVGEVVTEQEAAELLRPS